MAKRFYCLPSTEEGKAFATRTRASDTTYLVIMDVPICLVWEKHRLDPAILKRGLERALDLYPVVAARLLRNSGDHVFDVKGSKGVIFEVDATSKKTMPTKGAPSSEWNKFFLSYIDRELKAPFGRALMGARLTLFENGGSALCVNFAHILADGAAIAAFMNAWSYFCGLEGGQTETFPKDEPPKPVLERTIPLESIPKDKAHVSKYLKERDWQLSWLFGGAEIMARNRMLDTVADFRLNAQDLASLKQTLSKELLDSQWISSYEAIMASLLRALAIAEGRKEIAYRVLVNIRGRSSFVPKDYFGNALSFPLFSAQNAGPVSQTAVAFHDSLRTALDDEDTLNVLHLGAEYLREHGYLAYFWDRLRLVKPFLQTLSSSKQCALTNSWLGFDWFNVDFGSNGERPDFMRVASTFRHNRHIHLFPSSRDGELTVRVQLSSGILPKFRSALKQLQLDTILQEVK